MIIVPYAAYRLLFDASRDEYAFLIVVPLFWIFGFWGVVGPLVMVVRVRRLFRALETAGSAAAVRDALEKHEAEEIVVDLIARENGWPKIVAQRIYAAVRDRVAASTGSSPIPHPTSSTCGPGRSARPVIYIGLGLEVAMRFSLLFAAAVLAGGSAPAAGGQGATAFVTATGEIPRDSFKSWSLFLVCNPDWVAPERSADLAHLYHRFQSFGDAIGRDNLAVWFWKQRAAESDPRLAENVDVARSAEFCRVLGRVPSQGPYIVVTTEYPDLEAFPAERAVFELGGAPPAQIAKLLNELTDRLLLQGKVDAAMAAARAATNPGEPPAPEPPTSSLWMRLLEGTRQSLIGFGCMVKLQIATGLFSAELRACSGP